MLIPVPSCLKKSVNLKENFNFASPADTSSEEVLRLRTQIWSDVKEGLQYIFQTQNDTTLVFGACDNEIDAALSNLVVAGDVVLVGVVGEIGYQAATIAQFYGANVHMVHAVPGQVLTIAEISDAVQEYRPQILYMAHGDPSTGVLQPISEIGSICKRNDCILLIDAINSLGSAPLFIDAWRIDVAYAASYRSLGGPIGLTPITFGPRALDKIGRRKAPMKPCKWNVATVADSWRRSGTGPNASVSLKTMLDMRQALAMICDEGLGKSIDRYYDKSKRIQNGLQNSIGLELFVDRMKNRLPAVVVAKLPFRINGNRFVQYVMERYGLEVSADSNFTTDTIVRILLMHGKANQRNVDFILHAFHETLTIMIPTYVSPSIAPYY